MPTSRLFLLFSHALTGEQERDAHTSLHVEDILPLPEALQQRWSNVPPDLETVQEHIQPILNWLAEQSRPGDYVLIQGDFGAVYHAVRFALEHKLTPIYAPPPRAAPKKFVGPTAGSNPPACFNMSATGGMKNKASDSPTTD